MHKLMAYNRWAWEQVIPHLEALDDRAYREERPFFWGSLHGMTVHCLVAEWIWLQRCLGHSPTHMWGPDDLADLEAVLTQWEEVRGAWVQMMAELADADYGRIIHYRNTSGSAFALTLADIVQHVVNHSTEHRSQMTPVLHELGHPTEALDYMRFCLLQAGEQKED